MKPAHSAMGVFFPMGLPVLSICFSRLGRNIKETQANAPEWLCFIGRQGQV
jgi:hypothetical protein